MAGLSRDLVRLNSVLRMKRGQESTRAAEVKRPRMLAAALPEWIKAGSQCCYVSKTQGSTHRVRVQKVDEGQQLVTIFFDEKRWKKVPFAECTKSVDATLRPVWKAKEQPMAGAAPAAASASPAAAPAAGAGAGVEEVVSSDEGAAPAPPPAAEAPPASPEDPYGLGTGGQQQPKLVTPNLLVPRAVALSQGKKAEQRPQQHGRR